MVVLKNKHLQYYRSDTMKQRPVVVVTLKETGTPCQVDIILKADIDPASSSLIF